MLETMKKLPSVSLDTAPLLRSHTTNSYQRLPRQPFKLSILKLDGSLFDIDVVKNATVKDVKLAVEEMFALSGEQAEDEISWSHVWGHFCLCYQDNRLLDDKAHIRSYGVKDGDMLHFIRHMTIDYRPFMKKVQSLSFPRRSPSKKLSRLRRNQEINNEAWSDEDTNKASDLSDCDYYIEEKIPVSGFKLSHVLRGWLSYSTLRNAAKRRSEHKLRSSRSTRECIGVL